LIVLSSEERRRMQDEFPISSRIVSSRIERAMIDLVV